MRILVHEFVSGGGYSGRPVPASLAGEGAAMRRALVEDLARLPEHRIVATVDPRFPLRQAPPGVEIVTLPAGDLGFLNRLMASADGVFLVAPETRGCLEGLAARALREGARLLGPGPSAIRRASDKAALSRHLARKGFPHPLTRVVWSLAEYGRVAADMGFPLVVKPARGAGCDGVCLVRRPVEFGPAVAEARRASGAGPLLLQRYVRGVAASVSLLSDGKEAVALTVNAQAVRASRTFTYRGGTTPLDHPLSDRAAAVAREVCHSLRGLKGYIGVDLVLTESEAVVIEVNPRLTTAYLGVRSALDVNIAALALQACEGHLPVAPHARRRVRYTAAGRLVGGERV